MLLYLLPVNVTGEPNLPLKQMRAFTEEITLLYMRVSSPCL